MTPAAGRTARTRPRASLALVPGQVAYQLVLLVRSPLPAFITLVIPVMLLVALDLVTPEMILHVLGGVRVTQFLTPAMAAFAVLNAGFVETVIGTALARERGVLKRLRATPLPGWAYLAGHLGAALAVAACSVAAVLLVGIGVLHADLPGARLGPLVGAATAGIATSFALGVAVGGLVRSADAALPVSYGLLLPIAFISGVFFPAPAEASWLQSTARFLPAEPIARSIEAAFGNEPPYGITAGQLGVLAAWTAGALLVAALLFSWQPRGTEDTGIGRLVARAKAGR